MAQQSFFRSSMIEAPSLDLSCETVVGNQLIAFGDAESRQFTSVAGHRGDCERAPMFVLDVKISGTSRRRFELSFFRWLPLEMDRRSHW